MTGPRSQTHQPLSHAPNSPPPMPPAALVGPRTSGYQTNLIPFPNSLPGLVRWDTPLHGARPSSFVACHGPGF